jgi:endonuclease YncB( thermonuclease family)
VLAAVAVLVLVSAAMLVVGERDTGPSSAKPPPAAGGSGPSGRGGTDHSSQRTWQVAAAVDGSTIQLENGVDVRLVGIRDNCSTEVLARLVVGHPVTLTRRGPDKDAAGTLLRYVERDGVDIGMTLIQQGWANASGQPNPRRAIYRRVDERSPDICG